MNTDTLVRTILGPSRGSIIPLSRALELTAERIFRQHVAVDDLKLCSDICYTIAKQLYLNPSSVVRNVERCAERCRVQLQKQGLTEKYIGESAFGIDTPRMMVVCLATYAHFDKPYCQMIAEHPEYFTGQLAAVPSLLRVSTP